MQSELKSKNTFPNGGNIKKNTLIKGVSEKTKIPHDIPFLKLATIWESIKESNDKYLISGYKNKIKIVPHII